MAEMADDAKIIETVVRAHFDSCDYTADKIKPFIAKATAEKQFTQCTGMTCPMKGRPEQSFLDTFSERFMNHVRQVCTFAKSIPGFKCLHHDDQVCLLKSCIFEVLLVRLSGLFDNQSLVCLNGDVIKRETISAMPAGNAKFLMDSVFELAQRINRFRLADAEIGLFCSVVIIAADRPGLRNPDIVGQMQNKLKMVLQNILVPQHPDNASIFTELLTITHDLRTLNTLHTEKFLQQARVTGEQVREATCHVSREHVSHAALGQHLLFGVQAGPIGDSWHSDGDNQDRDSTGSRSPQSSDSHVTNHSYSYEDMRRSPIGSVSSSESLGSSETFSKLSVNDLKIHGVGSVLLNALTSPAMTAACPVTAGRKRERDISRCSEASLQRPEAGPEAVTGSAPGPEGSKCPYKARKLDSPSDSGIDSPKAQETQSTNTSVCSSPRSSLEDKVRELASEEAEAGQHPASGPAQAKQEKSGGEVTRESLEEQHPLLKRALQQPPQPFTMSGVTGFQSEVYHKKFRHSGRKDSNEPTSTQEVTRSPSPGRGSILASQLAAPPVSSVLASTLSRPPTIPGARESSERNEWLANLILERRQPSPSHAAHSSLLMCASNIPADRHRQTQSEPGDRIRHIPVPVAPTQPTSASGPGSASPRPQSVSGSVTSNPHLKMALTGERPAAPPASAASSSSSSDSQPLNLSTRTPPPADIPAEA